MVALLNKVILYDRTRFHTIYFIILPIAYISSERGQVETWKQTLKNWACANSHPHHLLLPCLDRYQLNSLLFLALRSRPADPKPLPAWLLWGRRMLAPAASRWSTTPACHNRFWLSDGSLQDRDKSIILMLKTELLKPKEMNPYSGSPAMCRTSLPELIGTMSCLRTAFSPFLLSWKGQQEISALFSPALSPCLPPFKIHSGENWVIHDLILAK